MIGCSANLWARGQVRVTDNLTALHLRLRVIMGVFAACALVVVGRLVYLPFDQNVQTKLDLTAPRQREVLQPARGNIYDRKGELLVTNTVLYDLAIEYGYVTYGDEDNDKDLDEQDELVVLRRIAQDLSALLGEPYPDVENLVTNRLYLDPDTQQEIKLLRKTLYPLLSAEKRDMLQAAISAADKPYLTALVLSPRHRRIYPHGEVAAHVLGLTNYDQIGFYGLEESYNRTLAGYTIAFDQPLLPWDLQYAKVDAGADLHLTLDLGVQLTAEEVLKDSLAKYGASSGSVVVMAPATGEILAMASLPTFNPNDLESLASDFNTNPVWRNPAIAEQFEPGSIFKIFTMAAALESGEYTRNSSYNDTGSFEYGGIVVRNWDGRAWGVQDMTGLMEHSLNVGAATLSTSMGAQRFYDQLLSFGMGSQTGVDLAGELTGHLKRPGDADWHESDLATNAFGQGVAVTQVQLITAVASVANGGVTMRPHLVARVQNDPVAPQIAGRPISAATAQELAQMLLESIDVEGSKAQVAGYEVAGKTGTAQIPIQLPNYHYDPNKTIATFVGWVPALQPQFLAFVRLNEPSTVQWGSQTAAPAFAALVERLVVQLQMPPDARRMALARP